MLDYYSIIKKLEDVTVPELVCALDEFITPRECVEVLAGMKPELDPLKAAVRVAMAISTQIEIGFDEIREKPYLEWKTDPRDGVWFGIKKMLEMDYNAVTFHYGVYGLGSRGITYSWDADDIIAGNKMSASFLDALEVYGIELDMALPKEMLVF